MELNENEQAFVAELLRQVTFSEARAKVFAGNLQAKLEASLNDPEPSQAEHPQTPSPAEAPDSTDVE